MPKCGTPLALERAIGAERPFVLPARAAGVHDGQPSPSTTRPFLLIRSGASGSGGLAKSAHDRRDATSLSTYAESGAGGHIAHSDERHAVATDPRRPTRRAEEAALDHRSVRPSRPRSQRPSQGLVAAGEGWFVLNAREARWRHRERRGHRLPFEGQADFPQVGITFSCSGRASRSGCTTGRRAGGVPRDSGEASSSSRVRSARCAVGSCIAPRETKHMIVGAEERVLVLAVGARKRQDDDGWGAYTVDEVALRHGAGVEEETTDQKRRTRGFRSPSRPPTGRARCPADGRWAEQRRGPQPRAGDRGRGGHEDRRHRPPVGDRRRFDEEAGFALLPPAAARAGRPVGHVLLRRLVHLRRREQLHAREPRAAGGGDREDGRPRRP